jgi:hypothetical protein
VLVINRYSRALLLLLLLTGMGSFSALAQQTGKIIGKIFDAETKEGLPFVNVKITSGGAVKGGGTSDMNGFFSSSPLNPGTYSLEVSSVGYTRYVLNNIKLGAEDIKKIDIPLTSSAKTTSEVEIVAYKEPLIGVNNGERQKLSSEQIAKMPSRSPTDMVATFGNVSSSGYGRGLNVRGNRSSDNAVFINGIRQFGASLPPAEAIEEISLITGGVPAQYGDALGGILSITTKSAARRFSFGAQGETSSLFDKYNYNFVGLNGSGPLLSVDTGSNKRTIIGFFGAIQYTSNTDAAPSALPIYKAKASTLDNLRQKPLRRFADSYTNNANYMTMNDLEKIQARVGMGDQTIQSNLNFDIQPREDIMITLGGNYNYISSRTGPREDNGENNPNPNSYQNLFNFDFNGKRVENNFNTFLRFRQTFNTGIADTSSLLRNVFYQAQVDYTQQMVEGYDPRFYNRLNEYNYVGKFGIKSTNLRWPQQAPPRILVEASPNADGTINLDEVSYSSTNDRVVEFQDEPQGISYEPANLNPFLSAINSQIFAENNIANDFQFLGLGGLFNGATSGSINDFGYFYPATGKAQTSYSRSLDQQFRFSFQAGAEIKKHNIKIGAEFEQRIISDYNTGGSLYSRARQQLNGHLRQGIQGEVIREEKSIIADQNDPNFGDTLVKVFRTPFVNPLLQADGRPEGQTIFDRNFRARNGLAIDKSIFLDEFAPNSFSINDFGVSDILDQGNSPLALWQGYTPYGKRAKRSSFFDFFNDTINRPVDAFRPIYYAGFIEDKFIVGDLILSLGLRVDAFDANMPVLKDKYTLTRLTTAQEFYANAGKPIPSSVGNDWAVYVNKPASNFNGSNYGEFEVVGFRSGDIWYDANGFETSNPASLERNGTVNPFFDMVNRSDEPYLKSLQRTTGITIDAYQDFKPQVNFMPRISFSFPLSEEALFYAHYDVLTQRPLGVNAGGGLQQNYASPVDYFSLAIGNGGFINNPNLKPQKKIDYALGFQQAISKSSAIKLQAFYSEIKDLIQVINVNFAYPVRYQTSGNLDFSVVKGLTLEYDLRRSENFSASASYTLSFAEGSASNFAGALLNTSTPNLRNTTPLSFDQRHAIKFNFDYRLNDKEGPEIFGIRPFENMGLNATFYTGSGTPYTQDGSAWGGRTQIRGSINGARLPWNNRTSVRIDKSFLLPTKNGKRSHNINVYMYVQNLFDAQNVLSVYTRTGSAKDDGFLASSFGQNLASQSFNPESYAMFYNLAIMNPDNISLPRRFRIGASYNF